MDGDGGIEFTFPRGVLHITIHETMEVLEPLLSKESYISVKVVTRQGQVHEYARTLAPPTMRYRHIFFHREPVVVWSAELAIIVEDSADYVNGHLRLELLNEKSIVADSVHHRPHADLLVGYVEIPIAPFQDRQYEIKNKQFDVVNPAATYDRHRHRSVRPALPNQSGEGDGGGDDDDDRSQTNGKITLSIHSVHAGRSRFIHKFARARGPEGYPERFRVDDDKVSFGVEYGEYNPPDYTAAAVLNAVGAWADDPDVEKVPRNSESSHTQFEWESGPAQFARPLNPQGRTGLRGRGVLGKWGANLACDPVLTRVNPTTNQQEVLLFRRTPAGNVWAIPGNITNSTVTAMSSRVQAMITRAANKLATSSSSRPGGGGLDGPETARWLLDTFAAMQLSPLQRRRKEITIDPEFASRIIYKGYVDDNRNTDNAWMETIVTHFHCPWSFAMHIQDEEDMKWIPVTAATSRKIYIYADHFNFVILTLSKYSLKGGAVVLRLGDFAPTRWLSAFDTAIFSFRVSRILNTDATAPDRRGAPRVALKVIGGQDAEAINTWSQKRKLCIPIADDDYFAANLDSALVLTVKISMTFHLPIEAEVTLPLSNLDFFNGTRNLRKSLPIVITDKKDHTMIGTMKIGIQILHRFTDIVTLQALKQPPGMGEGGGGGGGAAAAADPSGPRKKALCVGITYKTNLSTETPPLNGCAHDAIHFRDKVLIPKFEFAFMDVTMLVDDVTCDEGNLPTGERIWKYLKDMLTSSRAGDVLVFYYSGHGMQVDARYENPFEAGDGKEECILPLDYLKTGVICDYELKNAVDAWLHPEANFTMIADCCHSGTILNHFNVAYGKRGPSAPAPAAPAPAAPKKLPPDVAAKPPEKCKYMPGYVEVNLFAGERVIKKECYAPMPRAYMLQEPNPLPAAIKLDSELNRKKIDKAFLMFASGEDQTAVERLDSLRVSHGMFSSALSDTLEVYGYEVTYYNLIDGIAKLTKKSGAQQDPGLACREGYQHRLFLQPLKSAASSPSSALAPQPSIDVVSMVEKMKKRNM